MYRTSQFKKQYYKTGEVAKILGTTTKTIQNYDKSGALKVCRTAGGHRIVMREDLLAYLDNKGLLVDDDFAMTHDIRDTLTQDEHEYMVYQLSLIEKAKKYDRIASALEDGATLKKVKAILEE